MVAEGMSRGVSVYEMLRMVGRAKVATGAGSAEEITNKLRALGPMELMEEFHKAVVLLDDRGLLSPGERARAEDYAREWVHSQPMPRDDAYTYRQLAG